MGKIGRGSKAGGITGAPQSGESPSHSSDPEPAPVRREEGDGFTRGESRPASVEERGGHRPRPPDLKEGALAPRGGAKRSAPPDEVITAGLPGEGREYQIPRLPEDLKAGKISFQVLAGGQSYDITCAGPLSLEELHQVAENVSRTASRLQGSGIPDFKKAKFNPNGDITVDKPVLDKVGLLGTEVARVSESPEGPGRVKALLLRADGSVAVAGLGALRRPEGPPSRGDGGEAGEKSVAHQEPAVRDGFVSGQLAHVLDPKKRGAEERESLAYTRLDSLLSTSGAALSGNSEEAAQLDFRTFLQGALGAEGAGEVSDLRMQFREDAEGPHIVSLRYDAGAVCVGLHTGEARATE